ncbi:spore germination protein [Clostridium felsineum]|uniref:Spore germination protein B1 n=1 Tax=Clostridium felsineum TaxID=36839 RepID=A0A1S8LD93_9CLOT|nr:spore germination protein [Clostridium felsineum]URZ09091.1 Spore germination protein B1 [Clostridium felsineum]URZ13778.1 Spore germination protein B1 [Clostridium felsineum]
MFSYLNKKFRFLQDKNYKKNNNNSNPTFEKNELKLSSSLTKNINTLKNIMGLSSDIIYREFSFGSKMHFNAALIFLKGMTEKKTINETIMNSFMYSDKINSLENNISNKILHILKDRLISVGDVKENDNINELIASCLSGNTIFLLDGSNKALIVETQGWESRGIQEAKTDAVVRGPREAFCETLNTNMTLIRRKIKNPNLTFENMRIGKQTDTDICIVYLKGVVNQKLIDEVHTRLNRINTDSILESGYIEQFIEDEPFSIFPTVGNSEKPDIVAAKILEGRVAILIDGTPFVLTVPLLFLEGFQSSEDYYSRPFYASFIRLLRFISFSVSILAPVTYVVLSTFHQELIPTTLLFTMASSHEGVPFPAFLEALFMMMAFEILREAGVRLPRNVGQAVSIVGALVIGEAAVAAGLVGGIMVVVVALTAIASFVVPAYTDVTSILRLLLLFLGAFLGIYGVGIGTLAILVHLVSLRSFGSPYLSPFSPVTPRDLKDSFVRFPLWSMITRPRVISWHNLKRRKNGNKPEKPSKQNSGGKSYEK